MARRYQPIDLSGVRTYSIAERGHKVCVESFAALPPPGASAADFLNSIVKNEPVVCSIEEGMRATAVGILANRAIVGGEAVTIDDSILKGS